MNPTLIKMRDELNVVIKKATDETQQTLLDHKEELALAFELFFKVDDASSREFILIILKDALEDALATVTDAEKLAKAMSLVTKHK